MREAIAIPETELEFSALRAQGAGGQSVNKVASAIQLRFDIRRSSLPEAVKARLLALRDQRVTEAGVIIIKAQRFRSQELNRQDARLRLEALVNAAARVRPERRPTRPTAASARERLADKLRRGRVKAWRARVDEE